jgi:uncharacterized PurR-regulated membrane protein YhhQ (DUF165 family)
MPRNVARNSQADGDVDVIGYVALALFAACIPLANWLIGNVGTVCIPKGPCLIPVGFGFDAPSGVLMIGLALVLRDIVHRELGWKWAVGAILTGAALSAYVAPPALVVASGVAFLLSEAADMAVYTPLYRKRLIAAVFASSIIGAIIDSAVFLLIAFGSIKYLPGQVIGKAWLVLLAVPILYIVRKWNRKEEPAPELGMSCFLRKEDWIAYQKSRAND